MSSSLSSSSAAGVGTTSSSKLTHRRLTGVGGGVRGITANANAGGAGAGAGGRTQQRMIGLCRQHDVRDDNHMNNDMVSIYIIKNHIMKKICLNIIL
jgi:hypothetical protein